MSHLVRLSIMLVVYEYNAMVRH